MVQSMTGYGKEIGSYKSKDISVEIRSLNSKFFDLNFKCPTLYREKEIEVKSLLSEKLNRGKVELIITVKDKSGENIISTTWQIKEFSNILQSEVEESSTKKTT